MRVISLKYGKDINYDNFSITIEENENHVDVRAFSDYNSNRAIIGSFNSSKEAETLVKNIALAYEKGKTVYFID